MKKIFILCISFLALTFSVLAQDFPEKPNKLVNDYTNTLTQGQKDALESKLVALDDSTTRQISICVMQSVGEYDISDYAVALARKWGIGEKGRDNGVLILVALGDRKITIQVGYGLEGVIPDMYANRVIDNIIKPNFKQGKYYEGLDQAIDALIAMTKGEYAQVRERSAEQKSGIGSALVIFIIIIVLIIIISSKGGNGGGGVISGRGSSLADALIWGALSSRRGGSNSWSGDSSGGGGFGGFGGGSFGGGGASGSW